MRSVIYSISSLFLLLSLMTCSDPILNKTPYQEAGVLFVVTNATGHTFPLPNPDTCGAAIDVIFELESGLDQVRRTVIADNSVGMSLKAEKGQPITVRVYSEQGQKITENSAVFRDLPEGIALEYHAISLCPKEKVSFNFG